MNTKEIKPVKKRLKNPKHIPLLLDAILVFLPFAIPHASIPLAIIAIIKLLINFHLLRKEEE